MGEDELQKQVTEINAQLREYKTGFKIIQWALGAFGAAFITAMFVASRRANDNDIQNRIDTREIELLQRNITDVSGRIDKALEEANRRWDKDVNTINELRDAIRKRWDVPYKPIPLTPNPSGEK